MEIKLTDAEMAVMNIIWRNGQLKAGEISDLLREKKGWKKNTTYTLINRLVKKGAVGRKEPGYMCVPLLKQENVRIEETKNLLDRIYQGSFHLLVKNFIEKENLSEEQIEQLKKIIDGVEK